MKSQATKSKKTGPFKSCLIPHKDFIFNAWYTDRKSGREIQQLLSENFDINVATTTITRFIKVRKNRGIK